MLLMRVTFIGIILALSVSAQDTPAQDPAKLEHSCVEAHKCKVCKLALEKAYGYLLKNSNSDEFQVQILMGYVWLISGQHPKQLQRAVNAAISAYHGGGMGVNANWQTCLSAHFLSEVYKRQPTERLRGVLADCLRVAERTMEPTGGWGHSKGYGEREGYAAKGGSVDLGILTCMMYGAMLNMRACGIDVSKPLLDRVEKNLKDIHDGQGISYGSSNKTPDLSMGRASYAYTGIHFSAHATPLAKTIPHGLREHYKRVDQCHAHAPMHYTSVAMATHLVGPGEYAKFADYWVNKLIPLQRADGSIELPHTEKEERGKEYKDTQRDEKYVSSTASFALILLLQSPGLMEKGLPKGKRAPIPAPEAASTGDEPTATETPDEPPKPKPTGLAKPWLGVKLEKEGRSLKVIEVTPKSPAESAGLREWDIIAEFDGKTFDDEAAFAKLVSATKIGQKVKLRVLRDDGFETVELTIGAAP